MKFHLRYKKGTEIQLGVANIEYMHYLIFFCNPMSTAKVTALCSPTTAVPVPSCCPSKTSGFFDDRCGAT